MWNRIDGLRVIAFGTPGPFRDELNGLVLAGLAVAADTPVVCVTFVLETGDPG